jgi:hypothetical protein
MSQKSEGRRIQKRASDIRRSSAAQLAEIASKKDEEIDTSEIPERAGPVNRVVRDAHGRIVRPTKSRIRASVISEIGRRGISGHQVWIEARKRCETIPESAVYEFLSGKRQVGLTYLDAILDALDLTVTRRS